MRWVNKSVPNLLTVSRLLLSPIVVLLVWQEQNIWAGILFLVCCITDWLDGYLARKWDAHSDFGKTFDPVADKVLIIGTLFFLLWTSKVLIWLGILHILRDVSMDIIRIFMYKHRKIIAASNLAKWKTVTQMIGILIILFVGSSLGGSWAPTTPIDWISQTILTISLVFSLISFYAYIRKINNDKR